MQCPQCHFETPDDGRFCEACGRALAARCASCGATGRPGARFCTNCGTLLGAGIAGSNDTSDAGQSTERRQLTVVFCDLVGSTALSAQLDPEDMHEVIATYHRCCAEEVGKAGGFVAQYLGDGVLAYFGYPEAHEDDAERAVRAGLQLVAAVSQLRAGRGGPLEARLGIATGLVIVGRLFGAGDVREPGVVGETPNLAARLQAIAEPGQVVVSDATRRLTVNMFGYRDLGRHALKGLADPVQAWQVMVASDLESRFEARYERAFAPLVGRDAELDVLLRLWQQAKGGEGRVVLISGEAGIGKSRLTASLQQRLQDQPHTRLRYFCSPHHRDSALYPVIGQLERAANFEPHDLPETKLQKLERLLGAPSSADVSLLAELLSIPATDRFRPLDLSPQRKRQHTLETLLRQLEMLCGNGPVLMVYEDIHWTDPSSLEFLDATVERIGKMPVLLAITSRSGFSARWLDRPHVSTLNLERLERQHCEALVTAVSGSNAFSTDIVAEIIERTDGVPLFLEELTKAVAEGHGRDGVITTTLANTLPAFSEVPTTLYASLMARLDRLGIEAKEVAQVGAAIGREFTYELLAPLMQKPETELRAALKRLSDAGLVFSQARAGEETFIFKHALVRDAAYGSLLRGMRRELHARIVTTIEQRSPETAKSQPERLAQHCAEAGLVDAAIGYRMRAGLRALGRSGMTEALAQLKNGFDLLPALSDADLRQRLELDLQLALARTMMATQGYAALAVGQAYARAHELCTRLDHPQQFVTVLYGQFLHQLMRAELRPALRTAEEMLHVGEARGDRPLQVMGRRLIGVTLMAFGKFAAASDHLEQCLRDFKPSDRPFYATLAIDDIRVNMLCYFGNALLHIGRVVEGRARLEEALDEARRLSHAYSLVHVLIGACLFHWTAGEWPMLARHVEEALALSNKHGFPLFRAWGEAFQGCALAALGRGDEGLALLRRGLAATRATGQILHLPQTLTMLAFAYGKTGRPEEGLKQLAEAADLARATEDRWAEPELHRLRGELHLLKREPSAAEASFQKALSVSRRHGDRMWELCAAVSLARLWQDQGKGREARRLLAPIHSRFERAACTPNLREAEELLKQL